MQIVLINEDKYTYDIHSLYKAFYPEQEVKVLFTGDTLKCKEIKEANPDADISEVCVNVSKNELKKNIYLKLSQKTGKNLPWGNLTGIRPTRIVMNLIEEGKSDGEILRFNGDAADCENNKHCEN